MAGSSPLTRGKYSDFLPDGQDFGLIPAHAGKTIVDRIKPALTDGSSPLTRGKPTRRSVMTMRRRLIPAHAGKTLAHQVQVLKAQAHPRSRGENPYAASNDQDPKGSSPLTRGKHRDAHPRG